MKKLFSNFTLIFTILIASSPCHAGGTWANAWIVKTSYNDKDQFIFEVKWEVENGFTSGSELKTFVFDYLHWPKESRDWFYKYLPWTDDVRDYPIIKMQECKVMIEDAYKTKKLMILGQMGTVHFRSTKDNPNIGIVPYASISRDQQDSSIVACMLYAAPT
ncbi:hypothetical protein ACLVWU_08525 [Bdellovibrio sp. HCB290]|uniref:hypothetical protein n=1 Tax=Bdellovibrio sp. HCB290 TaxID=3394356 RepID=UPI0039B40A47